MTDGDPGEWLEGRLTECRRVSVDLARLVLDGSPRRGGENADHVRALAASGQILPPIIVHGSTMRVIDGAHRVRAALLLGEREIDARVYDGDGDEHELFALAVRLNVRHGLPLERADRVAAAERIVLASPSWSDRLVGSVTGLSDKTVAVLRRRLAAPSPRPDSRVGRDGRSRPVDGTEGRLRASRVIAGNPEASLRQIAREAGIAVSTAQDVRRRVRQGRSPLTRRQRAGVVTVVIAPPQGTDVQSAEVEGGLGCGPEPTARQEAEQPAAVGSVRRSSRGRRRADATPTAEAVEAALAQLRRDPSLRLTESGRSLLRLLARERAALAEYSRLIEAAPKHCADALAVVANAYASRWETSAKALDG